MHLLALLVILSGCKPVTEKPIGPEPEPVAEERPPLPPGEEYVTPFPASVEEHLYRRPISDEERAFLTPDELREREQRLIFHKGGKADIDGDGYKESEGKLVDGKFSYTIDENKDGKPDSIGEGNTHKEDRNFDGKWDYIETSSFRDNGGGRTVRETDKNKDGVFDERHTTERIGRVRWRERYEVRGEDGQYKVTEEYEHGTREQSHQQELDRPRPLNCNDQRVADMEPNIEGHSVTVGALNILRAPGAGGCSIIEARAIGDAYICALRRLNTCVHVLNEDVETQLRSFARNKNNTFTVGCNNDCGSGAATSSAYERVSKPEQHIWLSSFSTAFASWPKANKCTTMLHELMHAAGVKEGATHDFTRDDLIYSCSRGCGLCPDSIHATPQQDCARCAVGEKKLLCGQVRSLTGNPLPGSSTQECVLHGPDGASTFAPCNREEVRFTYCDETKVENQNQSCCASCPPGFSQFTGIPCSGIQTYNTCHDPAFPLCKDA